MKFGRLPHLFAVFTSLMLIAAPAAGQTGFKKLSPQQKSASRDAQGSANLTSGNVAVTSKNGQTTIPSTDRNSRRPVTDIVLNASGLSTFTVVRATGQPVAGSRISVLLGATKIATAVTNAKGQVRISGLKPGLHVFQAGMTKSLIRLWSPGTAPPQAVINPAIVDASDLVRGQYGYGAPMAPGLFAATVTAIGVGAVAIGKGSSSDSAAAVVPASP